MILYRKGLENLYTTKLKNELPGFYKRISDIYSEREDEDSAKLYRGKEVELASELGNARNAATEQAFAMLLSEEQKRKKLAIPSETDLYRYFKSLSTDIL